jgi:hypothetical protein
VFLDSDGMFSGHAYSSIIDPDSDGGFYQYGGMLRFGGLDGPGEAGFVDFNGDLLPSPGNARVNWETGKVTGWARWCHVYQNGCSGRVNPDGNQGNLGGGIDGWINLEGLGMLPWVPDIDGVNFGQPPHSSDTFHDVTHALFLNQISFNENTPISEYASDDLWWWHGGLNNPPSYPPVSLNLEGNCIPNGGSESYNLSIEGVDMPLPNNQFSNSAQITDISEDIDSIEITEITALNLPNNITFDGVYGTTQECNISGSQCLIVFYVEVNLNGYEYSQGDEMQFRVRTESGPVNVIRETTFNVGIIDSPGLSVSCSAFPSNVFMGQTVVWSASPFGGSGGYQYNWSGDLEGETTQVVERIYNSPGVRTASVQVTDSEGNTANSSQCSVNVLWDTEWEHR